MPPHPPSHVSAKRGRALREALLRLCPPLGIGSRSRLASLFDALPDNLRGLDRAAGDVERKFGEVGALLKEQVILNDSLVQQSGGLAQLAGGTAPDSGPQGEAEALVLDTLGFLEKSAGQTSGLLERFDRYQAQIRDVKQGESQLASTLVTLQIIERLFRIESASLPAEMQSVFESLTQEIGQLHGQMRETLTQQFGALSDTGKRIEIAKTSLKHRSSRLSGRISATRSRIHDSLADLGLRAAESRERAVRLDSLVGQMSQDISEVVVGLQYQDITAQKAQHVKEAVRELRARQDGAKGLRRAPFLRQSEQICNLESRQIAAIQQDLDRASASIAGGVRQLFDKLKEIDRDCLSLADMKRSVRSAESMADTLLGSLDEARELAELALSGARETHEAVASFGGAATNVTSALGRLSLDIRLIALNAQIQAAQAGAGTGLEVLSERTCDLSDQTSAFTRDIGAEIAKLLALLDDVVNECGEIRAAAELHLGNLSARGDTLREALLERRASTAASLEAMGQALERSHRNADAMLRSADLSGVSQAPLAELRATLDAIGAAARRGAGSRASHGNAEDLAPLNRRYTMESERAVHAAAVEGRALPSVPYSRSGSERVPLSVQAADANVELF